MTHELELWAGAECSVVRVGDTYKDELTRTGHDMRLDDVERLAALGVRALRVPVLWERTAPFGVEDADWSWSDALLSKMRSLGVRPIVGLVHHGSGPRHTHLLDPAFVTGLGEFAGTVARRYPWVEDWTPVNEPVTTARFSGLYGHWFPHARSDAAFCQALVNECLGTRAAMAAIREWVPNARLVQTEDMGTVYATRRLAYQARFENHRRFLSLDMLWGRLTPHHPLYRYLLDCGIDEGTLAEMALHPCPPAIVGLNYYVTSDRFLDQSIEAYPAHTIGGNQRHAYADVEAVRVVGAGIRGYRSVLELVWRRYKSPIALTEVHLGCVPEEQIRWLVDAWNSAQRARKKGIDVRAVTAWSAFGTVDWSSLLVEDRGHYEPGLFDVRSGQVRPTALAAVARDLGTNGSSQHPVLEFPGWWRRPERLLYPPKGRIRMPASPKGRPILVAGGRGLLGSAIARVAEERALPAVILGRGELDITQPGAIEEALRIYRPWAVINAAGSVHVEDAEQNPGRCWGEHAFASAALAAACRKAGMRLVWFSSDLVFDGRKSTPYLEDDHVAPLCVYGEAKAEGERRVLGVYPDTLIVRSSAFFGPWDKVNFLTRTLVNLRDAKRVWAADDLIISPTYLPDLAHAVLSLLVDGAHGVWHLVNAGALTWHELARRAARQSGISDARLGPCANADLGLVARRPQFSALSSMRGAPLPAIDDAVQRYCRAVAS